MLCIRKNRAKSSGESARAVEDARKNLQRVQSRGHEVHQVAEALKRTRERNHFAEQLQELMGINPGRG